MPTSATFVSDDSLHTRPMTVHVFKVADVGMMIYVL